MAMKTTISPAQRNSKNIFNSSWDGIDAAVKEAYIDVKKSRQLGDFTAWDPKGDMVRLWNQKVLPTVRVVVNDPRNEAEIFGKSKTKVKLLELYMVGPTRLSWQDARPTIVGSCNEPEFTHKMMNLLRSSHLMKKVLQLGFQLLANKARFDARKVASDTDAEARDDGTLTLCGARIIIAPDSGSNSKSWRRATLGGIVAINNEYYGMTTAHAFFEDEDDEEDFSTASQPESTSLAPSSIEPLDADRDGLGHEQIKPKITRRVYLDTRQTSLPSSDTEKDSVHRHISKKRPDSRDMEFLGEIVTQGEGAQWISKRHDSAFIAIRDPNFHLRNRIQLPNGGSVSADRLSSNDPSGPVIVAGSPHPYQADCPGLKVGLILPNSGEMMEAWWIDHTSLPGDCGTWILDPVSGNVHAMIVASSEEAQRSYCVLMSNIVDWVKTELVTDGNFLFADTQPSSVQVPQIDNQDHKNTNSSLEREWSEDDDNLGNDEITDEPLRVSKVSAQAAQGEIIRSDAKPKQKSTKLRAIHRNVRAKRPQVAWVRLSKVDSSLTGILALAFRVSKSQKEKRHVGIGQPISTVTGNNEMAGTSAGLIDKEIPLHPGVLSSKPNLPINEELEEGRKYGEESPIEDSEQRSSSRAPSSSNQPESSPPRPNVVRRKSSLDLFDRKLGERYTETVHYDEEPGGHHREREWIIPRQRDSSRSREKLQPLADENARGENTEDNINEKPFPRRGKTKMPKRIVRIEVLHEIGYPYHEEDGMIIIEKALSKELIDEVIERSRRLPQAGGDVALGDATASSRGNEYLPAHETHIQLDAGRFKHKSSIYDHRTRRRLDGNSRPASIVSAGNALRNSASSEVDPLNLAMEKIIRKATSKRTFHDFLDTSPETKQDNSQAGSKGLPASHNQSTPPTRVLHEDKSQNSINNAMQRAEKPSKVFETAARERISAKPLEELSSLWRDTLATEKARFRSEMLEKGYKDSEIIEVLSVEQEADIDDFVEVLELNVGSNKFDPGRTKMPSSIVNPIVVDSMGLYWHRQGDNIVIEAALGKAAIDKIIEQSREAHPKDESEKTAARSLTLDDETILDSTLIDPQTLSWYKIPWRWRSHREGGDIIAEGKITDALLSEMGAYTSARRRNAPFSGMAGAEIHEQRQTSFLPQVGEKWHASGRPENEKRPNEKSDGPDWHLDSRAYDLQQNRSRADDDLREEAEYMNSRVIERSFAGEATGGATNEWALVDVPAGTKLVRMEGAGGGVLEITWQGYNGFRRSKFMPDGQDTFSIEKVHDVGEKDKAREQRATKPQDDTRDSASSVRFNDTKTIYTDSVYMTEPVDDRSERYEAVKCDVRPQRMELPPPSGILRRPSSRERSRRERYYDSEASAPLRNRGGSPPVYDEDDRDHRGRQSFESRVSSIADDLRKEYELEARERRVEERERALQRRAPRRYEVIESAGEHEPIVYRGDEPDRRDLDPVRMEAVVRRRQDSRYARDKEEEDFRPRLEAYAGTTPEGEYEIIVQRDGGETMVPKPRSEGRSRSRDRRRERETTYDDRRRDR